MSILKRFPALKQSEYFCFTRDILFALYLKKWGKLLEIFSTSLYVLLSLGWAVPCVIIIRCLRPWKVIRLGSITCDHIGHFVLEVSWLWALRQQQANKSIDLHWFNLSSAVFNAWTASKPCNIFYAKLTKRNFLIYSKFLLLPISAWNQIIPGGNIHYIPNSWERQPFTRDVHGLLQGSQQKMPFTEEEDFQAKAWLRRFGWQEGDLFVCLLNRDSSYKGQNGYQGEILFRNSDISTYVDAVEWLSSQGVWVLRMGKSVSCQIPARHPRIIDYPFQSSKSDFLDIWLFSHCDLCISTGTGADMISLSYNRPVLCLNYTPLAWISSSCNATYAFKKLVWKNSAIPLNLLEYFGNCLHTDIDYSKMGIEIFDLTSVEILAAVQEQWHRLQQTWIDKEDDLKRHYLFWEIIKKHPNFSCYHGWIHPQARVATVWLRSMQDGFYASSLSKLDY